MLPPLTQWLLERDANAFKAATRTPFLELAGSGQIGKELLSQWLSQDRLYAQSYISFIGMMLAKLRLPILPCAASSESGLQWRVTDKLISALTNIRQELDFFQDVAERYDLDLEAPWPGNDTFGATPITRAYKDLFTSAGSPGSSVLEGMVMLWGTEKCYHLAWSFALQSRLHQSDQQKVPGTSGDAVQGPQSDADGGALRREFIPNWTSEGFGNFVQGLEVLLNELDEAEKDSHGYEEQRRRCAELWKQILYLEARFWPAVAQVDAQE